MKREADRLQTPISSIMTKEALGKFPIESDQLELELGEDNRHDNK